MEIINQDNKVQNFLLNNFETLNDDCKAIYLALVNRYNHSIPVLNYSGLYEALDYLYHFYFKIDKQFILGSQLSSRNRADTSSSKIKSVKALLTNNELDTTNYFVKMAYQIRGDWNHGLVNNTYMSKKDDNLVQIMNHFWHNEDIERPNSETDVYEAIINQTKTNMLIKRNPSWVNHETNRALTIPQTLKQYNEYKPITTDDPRIVISIVLKSKLDGEEQVKIQHPSCVSKIFPKFWEYINETLI